MSLMRVALAHGTIFEIAYDGSKGTHLPRRYDADQAGLRLEF